jgi:hypothetical protein
MLSNLLMCQWASGIERVRKKMDHEKSTHDDLPPLFNLVIFSHSKISPTQCIFGWFETLLNPSSKPIAISDFSEEEAIAHDCCG